MSLLPIGASNLESGAMLQCRLAVADSHAMIRVRGFPRYASKSTIYTWVEVCVAVKVEVWQPSLRPQLKRRMRRGYGRKRPATIQMISGQDGEARRQGCSTRRFNTYGITTLPSRNHRIMRQRGVLHYCSESHQITNTWRVVHFVHV